MPIPLIPLHCLMFGARGICRQLCTFLVARFQRRQIDVEGLFFRLYACLPAWPLQYLYAVHFSFRQGYSRREATNFARRVCVCRAGSVSAGISGMKHGPVAQAAGERFSCNQAMVRDDRVSVPIFPLMAKSARRDVSSSSHPRILKDKNQRKSIFAVFAYGTTCRQERRDGMF